MKTLTVFFLIVCMCMHIHHGYCKQKIQNEAMAYYFVNNFHEKIDPLYTASSEKDWEYSTNITKYNQQQAAECEIRLSAFLKEAAQNASEFDWKNFHNETLRRLFKGIAYIGTSILEDAELKQFEDIIGDMEAIYSSAKVCNRPDDRHKKCYQQELPQIIANSRDADDLLWVWKGWRDVTGKLYKDKYVEYVRLSNKAAEMEGFSDAGEYWRARYETEDFEDMLAKLWEEIKPLYQHLHAYTRRKLMEHYGPDIFPDTGQIPAHLLGNMWAQDWSGIIDLLMPYPETAFSNITQALISQGYTVRRMFETADEFFTSLGLEGLPDIFWENSMLEKPTDGREVVCHASAWDFYNGDDFRIKMCTQITSDDFFTIHHEMGHIQYCMQYKNQPISFRLGANSGFHEAVGDVIAKSVVTPEHLQKVGLIDHVTNDTAFDLNFLMSTALDKLAFMPFGFLMDQWRWQLFRGDVKPQDYNSAWWKLRCSIQGISPPIPRTDEDFDPGSKYHIPADVPYIRYFLSHILQFQFHKALCNAAGHTGPLHRCDIYQSQAAGQKLGDMLRLGSSRPWPEALESITGSRDISAQALVEYFQPILDWLREQNEGHEVAWDEECPEGMLVVNAASFWCKTSSIVGKFVLAFVLLLVRY